MNKTEASKKTRSPLLDDVQKILQITKAAGTQRLVVAKPTFKEMRKGGNLPAEVRLQEWPLRGRRKAVREQRHGDLYHMVAHWPEDRLTEGRSPLILCVTSGAANLHFADYTLSIGTGYFVVVPSGMPYGGIWRPHGDALITESPDCDLLSLCAWQGDATHVQCWLQFSRDKRLHLFREYENAVILDPRVDNYFQSLIQEATSAPGNPSEEVREICGGILMALLASLQREFKDGRISYLKPPPSAQSATPGETHTIAHAKQYMMSHMNQSLSIDRVARAVYMSRALFTERFRRETGQSFTEFLTARRMEEARKMLCDTEWTMIEVSHAVGLSPSRLRELFYRHEGVSPLSYRKKAQLKVGKG